MGWRGDRLEGGAFCLPIGEMAMWGLLPRGHLSPNALTPALAGTARPDSLLLLQGETPRGPKVFRKLSLLLPPTDQVGK